MYIALYNQDQQHITNLTNVDYELTERTFDKDNFSASGLTEEPTGAAKLAILNDDEGHIVYACFADDVTVDNNVKTVKGLDFVSLLETEILIDYTADNSFDPRLSQIITKITNLVFNNPDATINKIPVQVIIPQDDTDTSTLFGDLEKTYIIDNAYNFLKAYLKVYEYNIESRYDVAAKKIILEFKKHTGVAKISLNDFKYELQTNSYATNKAVATMSFDTQGGTVLPRPDMETRYYYLDSKNNVVDSNAVGNIPDRIYPVRAKYFEAETLGEAQYNAIYELANSKYIDNILIDADALIDPIDLNDYPLGAKIDLYVRGEFYKTLPISEKSTKYDGGGLNRQIKLGYKKILLTEILKR